MSFSIGNWEEKLQFGFLCIIVSMLKEALKTHPSEEKLSDSFWSGRGRPCPRSERGSKYCGECGQRRPGLRELRRSYSRQKQVRDLHDSELRRIRRREKPLLALKRYIRLVLSYLSSRNWQRQL